jgi:hypothetical protein
MTKKYLKSVATFSPDKIYRYVLFRRWGENRKTMMVIGLNPSTADEIQDDPTIRRCIGFAERESCDNLYIGNVFGLRSTDPFGLTQTQYPIGPKNDFWLEWMARQADIVIAAWGANPLALARESTIKQILKGHKIMCFGKTKSGAPKHPLYLSKQTPLEPWE